MALFTFEEIAGIPVYVVESHHHVLLPWAEIRKTLPVAPTMLSLDRHNDTYWAFWRHFAKTGKLTDAVLMDPLRQLELVNAECAPYDRGSAASMTEAVGILRNDEHIDAAVRFGILRRAFVIAFDQHDKCKRENGTFSERENHIYVLPHEYETASEEVRANRAIESENLDQQLRLVGEIAAIDGDPDWRRPAYILDIDLDYFRTAMSVTPANPTVFFGLIRGAAAITIATEPYYVRSGRLQNETIDADYILAAIKDHIMKAQRPPESR